MNIYHQPESKCFVSKSSIPKYDQERNLLPYSYNSQNRKKLCSTGFSTHLMKSIKTSALPKMKGLIFHLGTPWTTYVITSPVQTSAITSFLQKSHMEALISSFPEWRNTLLSIDFYIPAYYPHPRDPWETITSTPLSNIPPAAPHLLRLVCSHFVKLKYSCMQGHQLLYLIPNLPHCYPSLQI